MIILYILLYLLITLLFIRFFMHAEITESQCDFTKWQEFVHNAGIFIFGLFWPIWILMLMYLIIKDFFNSKTK